MDEHTVNYIHGRSKPIDDFYKQQRRQPCHSKMEPGPTAVVQERWEPEGEGDKAELRQVPPGIAYVPVAENASFTPQVCPAHPFPARNAIPKCFGKCNITGNLQTGIDPIRFRKEAALRSLLFSYHLPHFCQFSIIFSVP